MRTAGPGGGAAEGRISDVPAGGGRVSGGAALRTPGLALGPAPGRVWSVPLPSREALLLYFGCFERVWWPLEPG